MPYQQGDMHWMTLPGPGGSGTVIPHPHVIVRRHADGTVLLCALTTNLQRASWPGNVLLEAGEGGLSKQSVVVASKAATLSVTRLGAYIGALSPERVAQIEAGMRFLQRLTERPSKGVKG